MIKMAGNLVFTVHPQNRKIARIPEIAEYLCWINKKVFTDIMKSTTFPDMFLSVHFCSLKLLLSLSFTLLISIVLFFFTARLYAVRMILFRFNVP